MNEFSFQAEITETFLFETTEMLETAERYFLQLEKKTSDLSNMPHVLRLFHTIKGSALTVGFQHLGSFTHKVENLLVAIKENKFPVSSPVMDVIFSSNDALKKYILLIKEDSSATMDLSVLELKIQSILETTGWVAEINNSVSAGAAQPTAKVNTQQEVKSAEQVDTKKPEHLSLAKDLKKLLPFEKKGNILICDDEEEILEILQEILQSEGHNVYTTLSALDALVTLGKFPVDIIFTDLKMPKMNGLEFAKKVRERNKYIPIVFVTGHATKDHLKEFFELDVHDFINKPFTNENIIFIANRAMKTKFLWEKLLNMATNSFQVYTSFNKIFSLGVPLAKNDIDQKLFTTLENSMKKLRESTESILELERNKSNLK